MTANDLLQELIRPFTDSAVFVGMLAFAALLSLASAAGLLGLWLAIIAVPAYCRFLVRIAQARIADAPMEPMAIELFAPLNNIWALLPLVLVGLAAIAVGAIAGSFGFVAGAAAAVLFAFVLPASIGALALTESPETALNPLAVWEVVAESGYSYLVIPATFIAAGLLLLLFQVQGAPSWVLAIGDVYSLCLLFSMTGFIVARSGLRDAVGAVDPEPAAQSDKERELERERIRALNHAYGMFSRGNGDGGIAHIEDFVDEKSSDDDIFREYDWFFRQSLEWESKRPGLRLGRQYIHRLLDSGASAAALKVLLRCLHEDERFQPLPADRERLHTIAVSSGRDDLLKHL